MEPISATLAGIALVKQSVDFIKSNISTAKDIGEIAGQIDGLFTGQKQINDARNRRSGVSLTDQFGVESVAKEVLDAKIAAEKLQEVATMVDMRFGHGTWKGILEERRKRIQEAKEAAVEARKQAQLKHDEMIEGLKSALLISLVVAVAIGLFFFFMISVAGAIGIV